jgi:ribosomal protein L37AE/L43A
MGKEIENQKRKGIVAVNNIACPYCNKIIGVKSTESWHCEHCGKSLVYKEYKKRLSNTPESLF